uniref:Uncharacterized protein n=1 Tax=Sphaerodactylus townsendi TaxID=933632 RepID=A0ACB8G9Z0_9SAUR
MTPRKHNNKSQLPNYGTQHNQVSTPDKTTMNEVLAKLDLITETIMETNDKVKRIEEDLTGIKQEVKKIGTLEQNIKQMMEDVKQMDKRLEVVEEKMAGFEMEKETVSGENLWLEMKLKERYLRFRKIPEQDNEETRSKIIEIIAEFMGENIEDIEQEIDEVFRANSKIAKEKNLPRDVVGMSLSQLDQKVKRQE